MRTKNGQEDKPRGTQGKGNGYLIGYIWCVFIVLLKKLG
jgi:hypothetical protein